MKNDYPPLADEDTLVAQAQNGDQAAFGKIYGHYRPLVRVMCKDLLFGYPEEVEDAEQQVWIGISIRLCRYRPDSGKLANWIGMYLRWKLRDIFVHLRTRKRELVALPEHVEDISVKESNTFKTGDVRRYLHCLFAQLPKLPQRQKRAIIMTITGRPPPEIATRLGTSRPAVDILVCRARTSLQSVRHLVPAL